MLKRILSSLAMVCVSLLCLQPQIASAAAVGGGTFTCSVAWAPTSQATLTEQSTTITCPGVKVGDWVDVSVNADLLLVTLTGYVSAANTIKVILFNSTAGTVVPTFTIAYATVFPKYISP